MLHGPGLFRVETDSVHMGFGAPGPGSAPRGAQMCDDSARFVSSVHSDPVSST